MTERILVSGHRGDRVHGDENTMRAIRRAVNAGVDMVEVDVRMTKDGGLILMHDPKVDRTTNGSGRVRDLTLREVSALDAAAHRTCSADGPEPPAMLSELLEYLKTVPEVTLNIEYKDTHADGDPEFAFLSCDRITEALLSSGLQDRILVNSFDGRILERVYQKAGSTFLYHGFYPWFIMGPMETDPESFLDVACMQHCYWNPDGTVGRYEDPLCPEEWFDYVLACGIMPLAAPSLKTLERFEQAFQWGARIVNPDDPYEMLDYLKKSGRH